MSTLPLGPGPARSVFETCELITLIACGLNNEDISSLTRTCCRLFHVLAPLLWENVNGVDQIFALLPDTHVFVYPAGASRHDGSGSLVINFPASFSGKDLSRFWFYAPFVRKLEIYNNELYKEYSMQNWRTIYDYSQTSQLLPNLQSLVLTQSSWIQTQFFYQTRLPWLLLFMPPSLLNFTTCVTNVQRPPIFSIPGASHLLRFLAISSPHIQTLSIFPTLSIEPVYQDQMFISSLGEQNEEHDWFQHLSGLSKLQSVCITLPIPLQAGLNVLGQLPSLRHLELTLLSEHFDKDHPDLTLPPDAFPSLRQLALYRLPDLKFIRALWNLSSLSADLESVAIYFDKYHWPDLMSYQNLSDIITRICKQSPHINDFTIYPPYEGKCTETSEIIYTLLESLPLTRLCFAPVTPTVLNLDNRAMTYPNLRTLDLNTPWTSLKDLRSIAETFPNLDYLALKLTSTSRECATALASPVTLRYSQFIDILIAEVFFNDDGEGEKVDENDVHNIFLLLWPNARFLNKTFQAAAHPRS